MNANRIIRSFCDTLVLCCGVVLLTSCAPTQSRFVQQPIKTGYDGSDVYPEDNDAGYIPPVPRSAPSTPSYPEDNDNNYIPPRGKAGKTPASSTTPYYDYYYEPYQPKTHGYYPDEQQDPYDAEREIDMLKVYPLYY